MKKRNLIGERFGKLIVIEECESKKQPSGQIKTMWLCKCDCGNITKVTSSNLKRGNTKSCGCLHKEKTAKINKKHNLTSTRLYRIWQNMKNRCLNQKIKAYKDYGGRGIKVCEEWLDKQNGFINFYNWAIDNGYTENLTIDRIDNDGNYEPNNCRWATILEQSHNKRNCIKITYNNKTKHISEWAKEYNISRDCLWQRLYVLNWNIEKALLTKQKLHKN